VKKSPKFNWCEQLPVHASTNQCTKCLVIVKDKGRSFTLQHMARKMTT